MLDTIPYIFFFALRADGKGVFLCIYRPGCFRTVRGRSEGNWQENRLLYSKYLTLQYILMRSRNRERDLAYVAWKGGAWGIRRRKGCFQLKSRLYISTFRCMFAKLTFIPTVCGVFTKLMFIPTFCGMFTKITLIPIFCHHKCPPIGLRVFPPFVAYSLKSCLFPPFVACSPKSRLFPPFAITNVLLSGFGRRNIATSNWRPAKLE